MNTKRKKGLEPLLKYPGGKEQELPVILQNAPSNINRYFEPFVGGGAVYFNIKANEFYINDKSQDLINLYELIKTRNPQFNSVFGEFINCWRNLDEYTKSKFNELKKIYLKYYDGIFTKEELRIKTSLLLESEISFFKELNILKITNDHSIIEKEIQDGIFDKMIRMSVIERKMGRLSEEDLFNNIQTGVKGGYYMYLRFRFNKNSLSIPYKTFLYLFIRNYTYSGMFRYNKKNEFNVPYGGIGYNTKNLIKKYNYYNSSEIKEHLNKTLIFNLDFEDFLIKNSPQDNDFIFLDPPYDTEFSAYSLNTFEKYDQIRLANCLINECKSKWMLVIKQTDFILSLYENKGLSINIFDKKYLVSFMNRNDKAVKHLMITNYSI